jgi:acetolactate synthase small subunit
MRDVIMARMTAVESQMRREVEIVEDLRGVDYDIGYELTDVQVTGDGATIAAMTCIEKEIDFAKLTVRSVLLEEPS